VIKQLWRNDIHLVNVLWSEQRDNYETKELESKIQYKCIIVSFQLREFGRRNFLKKIASVTSLLLNDFIIYNLFLL